MMKLSVTDPHVTRVVFIEHVGKSIVEINVVIK
jgi:hypothetical protein